MYVANLCQSSLGVVIDKFLWHLGDVYISAKSMYKFYHLEIMKCVISTVRIHQTIIFLMEGQSDLC